MKEAQDTNLLSQESKLARFNLQLNWCPPKSTTPVLRRMLFQYLLVHVNLQPWILEHTTRSSDYCHRGDFCDYFVNLIITLHSTIIWHRDREGCQGLKKSDSLSKSFVIKLMCMFCCFIRLLKPSSFSMTNSLNTKLESSRSSILSSSFSISEIEN